MKKEDVAEFIHLVHINECLWNISSKNYKDVYNRSCIWGEIGAKFNQTGDEACLTFRKYREKYRRECVKEELASRCLDGNERGSNWPFLEAMRFMDKVYKGRKAYEARQLQWQNAQANSSAGHEDEQPTIAEEHEEEGEFELYEVLEKEEYMPDKESPPSPILSRPASPWNGTESTNSVPAPSITPIATAKLKLLTDNNSISLKPSPSSNPISSLEHVLMRNTQDFIKAMNTELKPYDDVLEFIRSTLIQLEPAKQKHLERELMKLACKYRYSNE